MPARQKLTKQQWQGIGAAAALGAGPQGQQQRLETTQRTPAAARQPIGGGSGGGAGAGGQNNAGRGGTGTPQQQSPVSYPGAGPGQFGLIPGGYEGQPGYNFLGNGGEYWSPSRWSVAPAGGNILAALMGSTAGAGNLGDWSGMGTLFDSHGTGDPLYQSRKAIEQLLQNGGVVNSRPELSKGIFASNALWDQQAPRQQTFADWFDIGNLGGASGPLLQRLMGGGAADMGYTGDAGKSVLTGQPFKGFQFIQQANAQNPYLDPEGERAFTDQYTNQMAGTATAPGAERIADALQRGMIHYGDTTRDAGQIGNALTGGVAGLNNSYEQQLLGNIDTEAQRSLAQQLPEVQAQMAAAGLDRSGASRGAAQQLYSDVLGQAMRDKQRTMAGFAETGRGLQAQALGQSAQGQFGALDSSAGRIGQGLMAGAQGRFGALEGDAARQAQAILGAQGLGGQALERENQRYLSELDDYKQMLLGGEGLRLQGLQGQLGAQEQAQQQFMQMFGMQEDSYNNALQNMLGLGEQQRVIDQQRLTGQIQAGMMPLDLMLRLSTGTTGPAFAPQQAQNPWANLGPQLAGGALGGLLGGIVNPPAPNALQYAFGNNPTGT